MTKPYTKSYTRAQTLSPNLAASNPRTLPSSPPCPPLSTRVGTTDRAASWRLERHERGLPLRMPLGRCRELARWLRRQGIVGAWSANIAWSLDIR
jgi:hypothetical protein